MCTCMPSNDRLHQPSRAAMTMPAEQHMDSLIASLAIAMHHEPVSQSQCVCASCHDLAVRQWRIPPHTRIIQLPSAHQPATAVDAITSDQCHGHSHQTSHARTHAQTDSTSLMTAKRPTTADHSTK
ncbi:hypothetical protein BC831DRAFT_482263 [Entophlyctis helioformis]|nr:hypothetical protein BC831DRAFT_482263 [Entophlyctis helioformis]